MKFRGFLIAIAMFCAVPATASASGYIRFEGIEGGSTIYGYSGWIELIDVQWNVGGEGSAPCHMVFTTVIDKASPQIHKAAFDGTVFPVIEFEAARPNSKGEVEYYTYEMKNTSVVEYTLDVWLEGNITEELVGVIAVECKQVQVTGIRKNKKISKYSWIWNVPEEVREALIEKPKLPPVIARPRRAQKNFNRTFDVPANLITDPTVRIPRTPPSTKEANELEASAPEEIVVTTTSEVTPTEVDLALIQRPPDVPEDAWYLRALSLFLQNKSIDVRVPFQPSELATRGEVVKLVLQSFWTPQEEWELPEESSFVDVKDRYFPYFEEAGKLEWIRGEGNCYGSESCYGRPNAALNRAAAATVLYRVFELAGKPINEAPPTFSDVDEDAWYAEPIDSAAAHCILQGDEGETTVRPAAHLNRAEMVTMIYRALENKLYPNCM